MLQNIVKIYIGIVSILSGKECLFSVFLERPNLYNSNKQITTFENIS